MSRTSQQNDAFLDAARLCVVEHGLAGASLRLIAQKAGVSVGSLSYHLGDRAQLIDALLVHEAKALSARNTAWAARFTSLGRLDDRQLVDVISVWLDDQAFNYRHAAITCCELILDAARGASCATVLVDSGERLWQSILSGQSASDEAAKLIARYCIDELPFSILLGHDPDYRLLRAATISGLLKAGTTDNAKSDWHEQIVDRLGRRVHEITSGNGVLAKPQRASLAECIAALIEHDGLSGLTHRLVAQAAQIAPSSVAHHFPQQRDLVRGGIEAMYERMRRSLGSATGPTSESGTAVVLLTHEMALTALREADLVPFAIDMRRRRGENVREELARTVFPEHVLNSASIQALVMAMIGTAISLRAQGKHDGEAGISALNAYRYVAGGSLEQMA